MAPYVCADPLATSHFSHSELLHDFDTRVANNHSSFAILLTRIAEFDERRLYLEEGYPSMKAFLVQRLRLFTDHSAEKRLTVARTARKYPGILVALYDGRLDVIAAPATPLVPAGMSNSPAPGRVNATIPHEMLNGHAEASPLATRPVEAPRARVVPLAPQKFGYQFTGDQETQDLYEQFRALMSHEIPTGEMALVYKAALKIGVEQMMKRKFAATDRPGHSRGSADSRHIPAAVKRAVSDRDQGRCAFVSEAGKRCESRRHLEYDHVEPVARGGQSTVENVRLLCRAHNQHEAERSFGAEFMERKRSEAR
jgi:5-methylcytosine-specific restriction endonuclease McrA